MKKLFLLSLICAFSFSSTISAQTEPLLGQVVMFAGNFAPRGWAKCEGQLLPINQHSALFSILGTMYGGDGRTTFGLPDYRGRVPMHYGQGPGLPSYTQGEKGGSPTNTLTINQMPSHNHGVTAVSTDGNMSDPTSNLPASTKLLDPEYSNASGNTTMNSSMIQNSGGGQAVNNMQPFQTITFIIALQGVFPSRN